MILYSYSGPTFNSEAYGLRFVNGIAETDQHQTINRIRSLGSFGAIDTYVVPGSEVVWSHDYSSNRWHPTFLPPKNFSAAEDKLPVLPKVLPEQLPPDWVDFLSKYTAKGKLR